MTTATTDSGWAEIAERLWRFVRRRVADAHAADDLAQDVLLKLHAHLAAHPSDQRTAAAWAYRAARHAVVDHYRSRAVRRHADVDGHELAAGDGAGDAGHVAARDEIGACARGMVRRLPEPYRTAVTLADLDGLDQRAAAERTGVSLTAAKSRVRRGRGQLRAMVLDCCDVDRDARGAVYDYRTTARTPNYCGG